ncbi:methyltransferase domain-containing protein [Candidatus Woesearchaeota archaeon]|jgi:tRNA (adenine57-N1/adenine58-N1)-methyltransferase catalytic subunit|nr:methyltransferase domain-containing protein [Cryomorphaceae bacterium]MBT6995757.1 methyltransferase domain-containing protein [Candidatus Woesearchaeota archaeon]MBT7237585.1 methyltransferase domain-containing protein [Candidatus Woesearchaeota archaeon]
MKIKKILIHKDKTFFWKEGDLHTEYGVIKEEDIKNKKLVYSNKNKDFIITEASFLDNLEKIKRGPQIMSPKDIGEIIVRTGMNKDSKVLEIGSGSGALTSFIARIAKEVISYDIREDHTKIVEKNLKNLEINNVTLITKDASKEIKEKDFDIATIDVKEPWTVLENVSNSTKSGGYIVSYSPSLTQSNEVIKLTKQNPELMVLDTIEVIERKWDITKLILHPQIRTIGHTAFLTFIRKI